MNEADPLVKAEQWLERFRDGRGNNQPNVNEQVARDLLQEVRDLRASERHWRKEAEAGYRKIEAAEAHREALTAERDGWRKGYERQVAACRGAVHVAQEYWSDIFTLLGFKVDGCLVTTEIEKLQAHREAQITPLNWLRQTFINGLDGVELNEDERRFIVSCLDRALSVHPTQQETEKAMDDTVAMHDEIEARRDGIEAHLEAQTVALRHIAEEMRMVLSYPGGATAGHLNHWVRRLFALIKVNQITCQTYR